MGEALTEIRSANYRTQGHNDALTPVCIRGTDQCEFIGHGKFNKRKNGISLIAMLIHCRTGETETRFWSATVGRSQIN
jgi:hypothetical protein